MSGETTTGATEVATAAPTPSTATIAAPTARRARRAIADIGFTVGDLHTVQALTGRATEKSDARRASRVPALSTVDTEWWNGEQLFLNI